MKRILLFCLLPLCLMAHAQTQRGLKGNYDTQKFPEISFVWNNANPELFEKAQFSLRESDKDVKFSFSALSKDEIPNAKKSILFLWEDMASHNGQSDFTRKLLTRFFDQTTFNGQDRFNIATFNRNKNSRVELQPLLPDFVEHDQTLSNAIADYRGNKENFSQFPLQSDLYLTINNGVELLKKQPADRIGIIVVVTAGLNIKAAGGSTEMETVRKNALESGIPIYVVKYPIFGDTPEINILAESTNGLSTASLNVDKALKELQLFYNNLNTRCYGQDYKITFSTTAKRDGKSHSISLLVDKVPQQILPFTSPDMTLGIWIQENVWLFVGLIGAFIVLLVLAFWLIRKSISDRNSKIAENESRLQVEISLSNQTLEDLKRQQELKEQQQLYQQQQQQAEIARKAHQEEEERLMRLMETKNLFPRLQCRVNNNSFTFNISRARTTVGRDKDNDLVLDNEKVSRHHAIIVFTGGAFEITDKGSTNKVILNGQFSQRATLKNGDIIGLGEVVITFYL